ncbi:hypothetical protein, partial [Paludisphaera sp.]|uniref:hypothetical protein n=1 Tax=Paludisphaera sp. TaxID=2017432 RepID=UPI00301D79BA
LPYLVADASKLREAVGWEPQIPIDRTLADMLADARTTKGPPVVRTTLSGYPPASPALSILDCFRFVKERRHQTPIWSAAGAAGFQESRILFSGGGRRSDRVDAIRRACGRSTPTIGCWRGAPTGGPGTVSRRSGIRGRPCADC